MNVCPTCLEARTPSVDCTRDHCRALRCVLACHECRTNINLGDQ